MTDATADFAPSQQSLGVGSIIGESFSIFFRKIITILMIAIVPSAIAFLLSGTLQGWDVMTGASLPDFSSTSYIVSYVASLVIGMAIFGMIIAMMVQFAYDAKLGRPANLGAYFSNGIKHLLPIVVLTIVFYIATSILSLALIVPGLWLAAALFVYVPAIVIDGSGFGGLGRSWRLTKGYRWPLVGLVIVTMLVLIIVMAVLVGGLTVGVLGTGFADFGSTDVGLGTILPLFLIQSVGNAIAYGFGSVVVALAYARLKEIKEGVGIDGLMSVFE